MHTQIKIWDSEGFLKIHIQNVYGKAILINLIPILVRFICDFIICSKTPFKGLATINEVKEVLIHIRFDIVNHYQEYA